MKLTWLGHAAFRLEFGKAVILFDPFLSGNPKFKGTVAEAGQGATHILITHGHDDHIGDAVEIAKASGAQLVSCYEVCMYLASEGVENINPGNTGGTIRCGDFDVTFTPAQHSSGIVRDGRSIYLGNPNGLIVMPNDGRSIYHMGDTDVFSDMALIQELYQPKIGLVPIGDRFTMGARTAALAVKRYFDFETVVPCHYGTFDLLDQTPEHFIAALGTRDKLLVPEIGKPVDL
jgi:L-ascorbate metabolism protein UlaG (beta-lactamase superfamily)